MDNKENIGQIDHDRINVNYELRYWSSKFGVTAENLKKAVEAAGMSAKEVEQI
ncbi:MAG: DUF3606 domain-containing protein [Pyrinomonadaceae bacterium]|nr:DUF3606 domain-containing protein [Sphingobacteriaceae bacterium]